MNLFGKAKAKPVATDTSATIFKLRETLDSLDKRSALKKCYLELSILDTFNLHRSICTSHHISIEIARRAMGSRLSGVVPCGAARV